MTDRLAFLIEGHGQVLGLALPNDLLEHRDEPVDRIGGNPRRRRQFGQGEEGAVKVTAPVDKIEHLAFAHACTILTPASTDGQAVFTNPYGACIIHASCP